MCYLFCYIRLQAFSTFDLDNNNFVGAAEIKHILGLVGERATDDEVDEMIRMCDADGDGQVTYDEFYKLMVDPHQARPLPDKPKTLPNMPTVVSGCCSHEDTDLHITVDRGEKRFRATCVPQVLQICPAFCSSCAVVVCSTSGIILSWEDEVLGVAVQWNVDVEGTINKIL